jgi:parvulin-like peptidyl-prolyl isomerase
VDLSVVPFQYLQDMLNTEILRQAAPGLGITVTREDIDQRIRDQFYPTPPPGQEADPDQLEREFNENYRAFLTQVRLSDQQFRRLVEEELLLWGLYSHVAREIPQEVEQVEVSWIRLESDGRVIPQDVRNRLNTEDFAEVAMEVGAPAGVAANDGYVGWVPRGAFPRLDRVLFGDEAEEIAPLPVGEISDPVFTQDGIYIIRKIAGPKVRVISSRMRNVLNFQLLENWQSQQLTRGSQEGWVRINFNSARYAWVADQVRVTAPRVPQQPQQPSQGGLPIPGR